MAAVKKSQTPEPEQSAEPEPRELPDMAWMNQFLVGAGQNLPNHVLTLTGRGKYITVQNPDTNSRIIIRTRQEAYRLVAWVLLMTDLHSLPDETPTDAVTGMALDDPYTYEEIEAAIHSS